MTAAPEFSRATQAVLRHFQDGRVSTVRQVATVLHMSMMTVYTAVHQLSHAGRLEVVGGARSPRGQQAHLWALHPLHWHVGYEREAFAAPEPVPAAPEPVAEPRPVPLGIVARAIAAQPPLATVWRA